MIIHNVKDRWGTWVSALAPLRSKGSGEVIAVFGIDFAVSYWYSETRTHMIHSIILVTAIIVLIIAFFLVLDTNRKLRVLSVTTGRSESLFRTVYEQVPVGIALVEGYNFLSIMNKEFVRMTGRSMDELARTDWKDITHPDDLEKDLELFSKFKSGEIRGYTIEKRFLRPDGEYVWTQMTISMIDMLPGIISDNDSESTHLCILNDISDWKKNQENLRETERSRQTFLENLPGMAYRCMNDDSRTIEFVSQGCKELTGFEPDDLIDNRKSSFNDLISPEHRIPLRCEWERVLKSRALFKYEYIIITADGSRKWVLETGQGIFDDNDHVEALEGIILDISDSKERQLEIEYISEHDQLTGLYNRRYYEVMKASEDAKGIVPVSVIIADINGLKIINDAFGHAEGDKLIIKTAEKLKSFCSDDSVIARTGGDDFTILIPGLDRSGAYSLINRIYKSFILDTSDPVSISIGFGTKDDTGISVSDAEKEAESHLERRKLLEKQSHHNTLLSSMMATMYAKSQETEEHSRRLSRLCLAIAEKIGFSQSEMDELHLLSMLHDIGKVGIDDSILNKPGKLTENEWEKMKKHPEIGYNIVRSAPAFSRIAEYILSHHEKWDGTGYPLGLTGEKIPVHSRILAVVDAYDAMTEKRVYREPVSISEALTELQMNAGTQFDPGIVKIIVELLSGMNSRSLLI